jgi:hypothetical protein
MAKPGQLVLRFFTVCLLVAAVAGCGGGGGGGPDGGTTPCSVSGVTVVANPTAVATSQNSTLTATVTSTGSCTGGVTWSATPSGGTLTPSGLTATFSATSVGTFTVKATSTDDTTKSGSATVNVQLCPNSNGTVVTHSSDITADETWAGGGTVHSVTTSIQIRAPATLTIQAGALVTLAAGASIQVDGDSNGATPARLLSAGTGTNLAQVVCFLPAVANAPWGFLHGVNEQSFIELHYTGLISAGAGGAFSRNSAIYALGPGNFLIPIPTVTIDQVAILSPVGGGVYLDSNAAFTSNSTVLGVGGASDYPITMNIMGLGTVPLYFGAQNTHDDLLVNGATQDIYGDLTITNHIPVRIVAGSLNVNPKFQNAGAPEVTLTVQAGAEIRFAKVTPTQPGAIVGFGSTGQTVNTIGRLIAVGDTAPIRFTSGEATKAPGDWAGLQLHTATGSQLSNVVIEYAGADSSVVSANCRPTGTSDDAALIIGSNTYIPDANLIQNSTIQYSAGYGIDAIWANTVDNSPDLSGSNTFTSNAGICNQTLNGLTTGTCPVGGGCTN